jgi:hypothetical protein
LRAWTIGLAAGVGRGVAYAALNELQGRDSAALVVSLSRLASQAPNDTSASFRGLPYVVRSAYRATLVDTQAFVLAELVRRVNVEANPYEERTIVIGERSLGASDAPYTLLFSERHSGDEERVPTTELIGLVAFVRDGAHAAFVARDFSDGGTYLMFLRGRDGRWSLRWQSAYAGC